MCYNVIFPKGYRSSSRYFISLKSFNETFRRRRELARNFAILRRDFTARPSLNYYRATLGGERQVARTVIITSLSPFALIENIGERRARTARRRGE